MQLVPAPSLQFRHISMWLGIFIGSFDALMLALKVLADIHWMSAETLLGINTVLAFLIVPAKLVVQNLSVTTEQKVDLIVAAAAQPLKPGEAHVTTKVNEALVASSPP